MSLDDLARCWCDQTVELRLLDGAAAQEIPGFLSHIRRSFGGGLGNGASGPARNSQPCLWDPPCALDVFFREQLRSGGDGLPKPFVLSATKEGPDLLLSLRIFGVAGDWALAAAEALSQGLRDVMPWAKISGGRFLICPEITARRIEIFCGIEVIPTSERCTMRFLTEMDATGDDPLALPHTILTRLLRRIDALARWQGLALDPTQAREIAAFAKDSKRVNYITDDLSQSHHCAPNRQKQKRQSPTIRGSLTIYGDLAPLWPLLLLGERSHIGRGAVQGLGCYQLIVL